MVCHRRSFDTTERKGDVKTFSLVLTRHALNEKKEKASPVTGNSARSAEFRLLQKRRLDVQVNLDA
jgi:hypothetical protein